MAMIGRLAYVVTAAAAALVLVAGGCAGEPGQATADSTAGADAAVATASASVTASANAPGDAGPSPGSSTPPDQSAVTIKIDISGGAVSPPPGRVEVAVGQTVHIEVSSDHDDSVHIHGYDIEVPVKPGMPATIAFVADLSGLFEVESHHPTALLTQLVVR